MWTRVPVRSIPLVCGSGAQEWLHWCSVWHGAADACLPIGRSQPNQAQTRANCATATSLGQLSLPLRPLQAAEHPTGFNWLHDCNVLWCKSTRVIWPAPIFTIGSQLFARRQTVRGLRHGNTTLLSHHAPGHVRATARSRTACGCLQLCMMVPSQPRLHACSPTWPGARTTGSRRCPARATGACRPLQKIVTSNDSPFIYKKGMERHTRQALRPLTFESWQAPLSFERRDVIQAVWASGGTKSVQQVLLESMTCSTRRASSTSYFNPRYLPPFQTSTPVFTLKYWV